MAENVGNGVETDGNNVEKAGESKGTDGENKEIEGNKEEIEEQIAEQMFQEAVAETNKVTGTDDVIEKNTATIVYYNGKAHEVLSEVTEYGLIVPEDGKVRIKEVGTNKSRFVAPQNLYSDDKFQNTIKTFPPQKAETKKKKVSVDDYANQDVDVNDVADAYLREFGEELSIETLQGQYSELSQEAETAPALQKAKAKVALKRLQEIATALGNKVGKNITLATNQVEEIVDEVETIENPTFDKVVDEIVEEIPEEAVEETPTEDNVISEEVIEEEQKPIVEEVKTNEVIEEKSFLQKEIEKAEEELDVFLPSKKKNKLLNNIYEIDVNSNEIKEGKEFRDLVGAFNPDAETTYDDAYNAIQNIRKICEKYNINIPNRTENAFVEIENYCKERYKVLGIITQNNTSSNRVEESIKNIEDVIPTQEKIDAIPLVEFTSYFTAPSQSIKLGLTRVLYPAKEINDRFFVTINNKGERVLIDRENMSKFAEISLSKGTIMYLKSKEGEVNTAEPYLVMKLNNEKINQDVYPLFETSDPIRSIKSDNLYVLDEKTQQYKRYKKSEQETKKEKIDEIKTLFSELKEENINYEFSNLIGEYIDVIKNKIGTHKKAGSKLGCFDTEFTGVSAFNDGSDSSGIVKSLNEKIDIINTIAEDYGFPKLNHMLTKKHEAIERYIQLLYAYSQDFNNIQALKNSVVSLNIVKDILNDDVFKAKQTTSEQIDFVNDKIDVLNQELEFLGLSKISKIRKQKKEISSQKLLENINKAFGTDITIDENIDTTSNNSKNETEDVGTKTKEEYIAEITAEYGPELAEKIYNYRLKEGTLDVRKSIPSTIADEYANEYWYVEERKRFEQTWDILFAGGVKVVNQKLIDKILAYKRPLAVTQKNIDVLKQWIGGVDIEVVKPDHKDRPLRGGAFGWYDIAKKKVVVVEGAPISVVLHEVGWHATLDWAKTHDKKMYDRMLHLASEAPAEIRLDIVSKYGELSEEAFLDELGAEMFTRASQKKLYEYITTQESRRWWQKMFDAFNKVFEKARLKLFRKPIKSKKFDFASMANLNSTDFLNALADTMIKGKVLGEWSEGEKVEARNREYHSDSGYYLYDTQRRYNIADLYNSEKSSNFVEEYKFNKEQNDLRQRGQRVVSKRYTPQERKGFEKGNRILEISTYLVGGSQSAGRTPKEQDPFDREEQRRETQEKILEDWAKDNNLWIEDTEIQLPKEYDFLAEGGEADVYLDSKNNRVVKAIGLDYFVSPQMALDRIVLHNHLFGDETPLSIVGFGRNSEGYFKIIVEQPYIKGESLTLDKIEEYIESIGFNVRNRGNWTYTNDDIYISDLHDENVIRTPEGQIAVIDADIRLNAEELGYGGTREIDYIEDNDIRYMSSGSQIYGVQQGTELFVNIRPDQKIGECADLWLEQLRQSNPQAYELVFGDGENPNIMSDLMAIVRDKLKGLVDSEDIDLSDEVLRDMTFEEFMTFADALQNLNMQNVSKSITRVQEDMSKFEAMISAESPTSNKVKQALERWWTAAMDDNLPIIRMSQGLNAWLVKNGLPKLDSRYDIANLRNLAPSKSKTTIESFRDRGEFKRFIDQVKVLDKIVAGNSKLKELSGKLTLDRVNSEKEALHSLVEVYMLAKDNVERRSLGLPSTSNDAWLKATEMADVEFVEAFEAEFTTKQLADFWRAKNKATNVSLDYLLKYGILTQEKYDEFKKRQFYVPQRGFDSLELEENNDIPKVRSTPNPKLVQALYNAGGRNTMATSPIAQILMITDNAIRTSLNNEYRKAMLDLVRMYPEYFNNEVRIKSTWYKEEEDENGNKKKIFYPETDETLLKEDKETREKISNLKDDISELQEVRKEEKSKDTPDKEFIKELSSQIEDLRDEVKRLEDNIHYKYENKGNRKDVNENAVFVKANGGDVILEFEDKRIANALNNRHFDQALASNVIKKANRYCSNIYTTYNPVFGFKNLARDIMQIMLNVSLNMV